MASTRSKVYIFEEFCLIMELIDFLVEAKKNTYAGNIGGWLLGDGGKRLKFCNDEFEYRDLFYGYNPFFGQETVKTNGKVIWLMNYGGGITDNSADQEQTYRFLKTCLLDVPREEPYRGPSKIIEGDMTYENRVEGNIERFQGTEIIKIDDKIIYNLNYGGGIPG